MENYAKAKGTTKHIKIETLISKRSNYFFPLLKYKATLVNSKSNQIHINKRRWLCQLSSTHVINTLFNVLIHITWTWLLTMPHSLAYPNKPKLLFVIEINCSGSAVRDVGILVKLCQQSILYFFYVHFHLFILLNRNCCSYIILYIVLKISLL
jgi:hypothetical protein